MFSLHGPNLGCRQGIYSKLPLYDYVVNDMVSRFLKDDFWAPGACQTVWTTLSGRKTPAYRLLVSGPRFLISSSQGSEFRVPLEAGRASGFGGAP